MCIFIYTCGNIRIFLTVKNMREEDYSLKQFIFVSLTLTFRNQKIKMKQCLKVKLIKNCLSS